MPRSSSSPAGPVAGSTSCTCRVPTYSRCSQRPADGVRITAETCPHYLTFTAEEIPDGATQYKCCPPIREAANRELLWDGLRDGVIDLVVSDHSPSTTDLKRLDTGDFGDRLGRDRLPPARPARGLDRGPPPRLHPDRRRPLDVRRPAAQTGLPHKGSIEIGYDADFCVLAPRRPSSSTRSTLQHKNAITPYDGRTLDRCRPQHLAARRTRRHRRRPARPPADPRRTRTHAPRYYAPTGGLPAQTELTTDRAVFTEAYAVLPRGTMRDIVTSQLPFWDDTRLWVIARPLSGFAETFSQYVVEVAPGGGSDRPETDPGAEAVLFVIEGTLTLTLAGESTTSAPGGYAYLPPGRPWTLHNTGDADRAVPPGSARPTSRSRASTRRRRS